MNQKSEVRSQKSDKFKCIIILVCFLSSVFWHLSSLAAEKWQGVDESVVEKIAKEHGREAQEPFINLQGDLLLFVFLTAGAVGGFAAGYYWRKLTETKQTATLQDKK